MNIHKSKWRKSPFLQCVSLAPLPKINWHSGMVTHITLRRWRWKASLSYTVSSRPAWAPREPVSKEKDESPQELRMRTRPWLSVQSRWSMYPPCFDCHDFVACSQHLPLCCVLCDQHLPPPHEDLQLLFPALWKMYVIKSAICWVVS